MTEAGVDNHGENRGRGSLKGDIVSGNGLEVAGKALTVLYLP